MTETNQIQEIRNALDVLEDRDFENHSVRSQLYKTVEKKLSECNIDDEIACRLLADCTFNLYDGLNNPNNAPIRLVLTVITKVIDKVKAGECSSAVDFLPSALGTIKLLNYLLTNNKKCIDNLLSVGCSTLLSYPSDILVIVAEQYFKEIKRLFTQTNEQVVQFFVIIHKMLKILPPEKKRAFVERELNFWFMKIIPLTMNFVVKSEHCIELIETLEALTEVLVEIEYSDLHEWFNVLECLSKPSRYPVIIKSLVEKMSVYWHRLWIIFIKLLKSQITKIVGNNGSPINSMLHPVECAFKMDPENRYRAFKCWNVLIDNFAFETNNLVVHKRVKLLLIPLRSNNTKTTQLAVAKFETWWHLLCKFHANIDNFADSMLIPFLHFCFGKQSLKDKGQVPPGQLSDKLKDLCVQSLVEIFGHLDCDGCTTVPRLENRLINTHLLTTYWDEWKYSLKEAIVYASHSDNKLTTQQFSCIFKSLLATLCELPDNSVRRDLVDMVLYTWIQFIMDNLDKLHTQEIILDIVIPAMVDERYKKLLIMKDDKQGRLRNIVCLILQSILKITERINTIDFVLKVKPLVALWISESKSLNECIQHFVKTLLVSENSWLVWTLIAEAVGDSINASDHTIMTKLLNWPLQQQNLQNIMTTTADVQYSASVWTNLYCNTQPEINEVVFPDELLEMLGKNKLVDTAQFFVSSVLLYVLKKKLANSEEAECKVEIKLLNNVLEKIKESEHIETIIPILIDTSVLMINKLLEKEDKDFAVTVVNIIRSILNLLVQITETPGLNKYYVFLQDFFQLIEKMFKTETYSEMKNIILNDLITCHTKFTSHIKEKNFTGSLLKLFLSQCKDSDLECQNKIRNVLGLGEVVKKNSTPKKADEKFVAPEQKPQKKKKEPSIVNKVVENGEEYVVVKSNWKFNPKKLTENQKEKMNRKREDIPALYQDLSQSQDEFKLTTWKTDSQDTTTTSSKSASKTCDNDSSIILKNIPNSEVVPKIIENLMSENKDLKQAKSDLKIIDLNESKSVNSPISKSKTPRMAIKDRVFRNVRHLMEKSSNQSHTMENNPSESAIVPSSKSNSPRMPNQRVVSMLNIVNSASASKAVADKQPQKSDENIKTPTNNHSNTIPSVNSAPAVLPVERPSRIKRKPKKFDDVQLIAFKRRQSTNSLNNSQSYSQGEDDDTIDKNKPTIEHNVESFKTNDPITGTEFLAKSNSVEPDRINTREITLELSNYLSILEAVDRNVKSQNLPEISLEPVVEPNGSLNESKSLLTPNKAFTREIECIKNKITEPKHNSPIKDQELKQKDANEVLNSQCSQDVLSQSQIELSQTPKASKNKDTKKSSTIKKKSRVEKKLAIDMVEGHPYLNTPPEKRVRKRLMEIVTPRRNKIKKQETPNAKSNSKNEEKRTKIKKSISSSTVTLTINETQEKVKQNTSTEDVPCSEDVIESSQDSTATTISTKSTKSPKRIPIVTLERHNTSNENTQSLLDNFDNTLIEHKSRSAKKKHDSYNDSVIPCNKTVIQNKPTDVTATMDTEIMNDQACSDVIIINDDIAPPITINTENIIDLNTEDIANADTQSMDPSVLNTQDDTTKTFNERLDDEDSVTFPAEDKSKRKQDFMNNTLELSPIKIMSPLREEKTPSPETSNDYIVIQLSSPVHSNGEPFEKCDSPEMFTEEKLSPDKRDLSPPREITTAAQSSPSSALSLKKNRPQVRSGGRAAQMLGLCVPDNEKAINVKTHGEEESKKNSTNTPARRNLRMIYNAVADETEQSVNDSDDSGNFLKLKKSLPPVDSSPSGPILKRKLAEIADDATVSPVSKKKRVSFHDPPVSTTMSVAKYIEPAGTRSPSNSAIKRQERQTRSYPNMKSPKRLDNVFKLDTILTKAVESFSENDISISSTNDTEMSSIEQTPVVEIVKISELNDTDPICLDLIDCKDPISNIASELSSPTMSSLLTKELEGKVECIGDLAKMTEVEVNRLCIKVPKVAVAKKVLTDYIAKTGNAEEIISIDAQTQIDTEMQTDNIKSTDTEMQTNEIMTATASIQCKACSASTSTQTHETGSKSTKDAIIDLKEKSDFVFSLTDILDDTSKLQIADTLPNYSISSLLLSKLNTTTCKQLLDSVIEKKSASPNSDAQLSFLEDYITEKFQLMDLVMFCSNLLKKAYNKPV